MSLFSIFKSKKKTDTDIIASVEEEDITKELCPAPVVVIEQPQEEIAEEPVKEVAEEPVQTAEENVEQSEESVLEEQEEFYDDKEDVEYSVYDVPADEEEQEEVVEEVAEEPVQEEQEEVVEEVAEEPVQEEQEEPVEEVAEEPVQEEQEEVVEEVTEEQEEPQEETAEELVEEIPEAVEISAEEEIIEEVAKEPVYQPTFSEKMDIADDSIQKWYDEIKNYALRFKKLTSRISKKYDSINQGRFQFVKISLAGKTLKLNLNMDINQCDPKYHCVDKKSTKTYEDVPVQMRIKSDRGLRYGKELVDQCAEIHGLIENPKFKPVDSLGIIRKHLEIGNAEDIIIETDSDEE